MPNDQDNTKIAELRQRLQSLSDGIRAVNALKGDLGDEDITFAWAMKRLFDEAHDANAFLGSI